MSEEDRIEKLETRVRDLEMQVSRYRGFVGAIVLIISGVGFVIEILLPFIKFKSGN